MSKPAWLDEEIPEQEYTDQYIAIEEASKFSDRVQNLTDSVAEMLIEKNKSYGNSALDPVRIFSQADATEQIKVRIDDKLSRIQNSDVDSFGEDTVLDLIGYLFLYKLALENDNE